MNKYVTATKGDVEYVLRLEQITKENFKDFEEEFEDTINVGTFYNGVIGNVELYDDTLEKTIKYMELHGDYKNVREITKKEFDDFECEEDYHFIKWRNVIN